MHRVAAALSKAAAFNFSYTPAAKPFGPSARPFERTQRLFSTLRSSAHRMHQQGRTAAGGQQQQQQSKRTFSSFASRFGARYSELLESHPFTTQMATSGVLGGAADVTTQYLEHGWAVDEGKEAKPWDWRRLAAVTMFGIAGMGPMGHVWYIALDKFTRAYCRSSGAMVVTKVAGDTFVFGPVCLWLFFATVSLMEGTEWETIRRKLWRDFVPTYVLDYSFWPLVQGTNFALVPVRHQLLVVNTVCYFDDIFLTFVQHNGMPAIFTRVEDYWKDIFAKYLLGPDEKIEYYFFEDEEDDDVPVKKAITQ